MADMCEACGHHAASETLTDKHPEASNGHKPYKLCLNCLLSLVNVCLTPEEYKNLLKNGHKDTEFYLHDDFYDEAGHALQPKLG